MGSIPVGSIGPNAIPVGSIGLNQILLTSLPVTWAPILAGTPLERRMLQALTLENVYANATTRARFGQLLEAGNPARPALLRALFGGVSLAALLLGDKTLSQIPPPEANTWCEAITEAGGSCAGVNENTNTVAGLNLASAPVGSIPVGSIPVGSIAGGIAGTPVGSIPVGSIDIAATPLAAILLKDIANPNAVVDCARISCTTDRTLGHAAALVPTAIRPGATLAMLEGNLDDTTLNEIIVGIVPRSALAWEDFPIDGLQLFTARPVLLRYTAEFDLECAQKAGLAVTIKLPDGDIAVPGTTTLSYGDAHRGRRAEPGHRREDRRPLDGPARSVPVAGARHAAHPPLVQRPLRLRPRRRHRERARRRGRRDAVRRRARRRCSCTRTGRRTTTSRRPRRSSSPTSS